MSECDSRVDSLNEAERRLFWEAAKILDRLEIERRSKNEVMFDSCDQYYITFTEVADRLRMMADL